MSSPERGPGNGQDQGAAKVAAPDTVTLASGLAVPATAVQRSPFPFLQVFKARAQVVERPPLKPGGQKRQVAVGYELGFGVQAGIALGREFMLNIPVRCPGRHLAALLRKMADNLDALVDDCEKAGEDPRDQAAAKGPDPAPIPPCAECGRTDLPAPGACLHPACPRAQRAPGGNA
jgi:hypothetical protein